MSQAVQTPMTTEEFLAWERGQDVRWEFDGFVARAMTGGSFSHAAIEVNLIAALNTRLRGSPCRVFGNSLKVRIGDKIRYPDAVVTCTRATATPDIIAKPIIIFEVLSKSTQRIDKTAKLLEYRSLDTLQRYVLLEQDQVLATVYARSAAGWTVDQFVSGSTLDMPEAGIAVPLDEFYIDVEIPSEVGGEEA